jgi:hypothetical protein
MLSSVHPKIGFGLPNLDVWLQKMRLRPFFMEVHYSPSNSDVKKHYLQQFSE